MLASPTAPKRVAESACKTEGKIVERNASFSISSIGQLQLEKNSYRDNSNPDLIYINQNLENLAETGFTHPLAETTHPTEITCVKQKPKPHLRVSTEDIKTIADAIFESRGRGLTYKDLLKPPYKCAETRRQAMNILYYHKKRGTLYTNSSMTIPQQYFVSREDAEEAAINYKKMGPHIAKRPQSINCLGKSSTYPHPTGVAAAHTTDDQIQMMAIEDKKVDNLAEAIDRVSQDKHGELPTGLHNIRIHLSLPQEFVTEVYYERLYHIPEPHTKEKAKEVETKIDGFAVKLKFYPKSTTVVIMVPCSDTPFPISLNSPNRVTSDFNSFVAQIRRVICAHLSDNKGKIVPPIHSPAWRLVHADINWDIPTTMLNYLGMDGIQVTKVNDIIVRLYRKRIMGERLIRVEEGVHSFVKDTQEGFNESIGSVIVEAARIARKELSGTITEH